VAVEPGRLTSTASTIRPHPSPSASAVTTAVSSGSLRRAYLEWVEEQIEEFKETVPRTDLLRLADEVVEELCVTNGGQYQLTELLLWEAVDRKIFRLLDLPGYRGWRTAHRPVADEPGAAPMLPLCVE